MPPLPDLASVPVWPISLLLILVSALGIFLAVTRVRQPLWPLPALLAGALGVAMYFSGPTIQPVPQGASLQNYSPQANFKDRYEQDRTLYGDPIGGCYHRRDLLVCPTLYVFMEFHPSQSDSKYLIQHANLGDELRIKRGLPRDPNPVLPSIVIAYLADLKHRSSDHLYWVGYPITNPRIVGDRTEQYFDKIVLSWPTASEDPSQIRREMVGSQMWSIEHGDPDPASPDPWTSARRLELLVAALLLLVSALPLVVPRLAGRRRYVGGFDL